MCERLVGEGVLSKDTHETTFRLAPPLVVEQEDLDFALHAVRRVLGADSGSGALIAKPEPASPWHGTRSEGPPGTRAISNARR